MPKAIARKLLTAEERAARRTVSDNRADFRTAYANNVSVAISPWDFRLSFGVIKTATKEQIEFEQHSEIYMSPQHAKAFLEVLAKKVTDYESAYGTVPDFRELRSDGVDEENTPAV